MINTSIYLTNTYFIWIAVAKTDLYEDIVIFTGAKTHLTNYLVNVALFSS